VFILGVLIAVSSALGAVQAQEKPAPKPSNMGGSVTGGMVTPLPETVKSSIANFRFDPGARTKWHTHEVGQIVLCDEGVCLTQEKGGPVLQMTPGDVVYVGPGVMHWHGAAPDQGCVQFNVSRGASKFLDEVTDAEYKGSRKKL
jgi:quercetin dioxygenase-like cupin family protein